jgi:L-ascorbate metabolism protein UlaG (beta-lactamase superfamily)
MQPLLKRIALVFGVLLMATTALGFAVTRASSFGAPSRGERLERNARSPRWQGKSFTNPMPTGTVRASDTWKMLKAYATNHAEVEPTVPLPVAAPGALEPLGDDRLRITWMGHSSMLVEIDGRLILTDPVWGPRASPFSWSGPARFHAPPLPIDQLPRLDAVVLSHDHYDHLDHPSIFALANTDVPFVVPLGLGAHLESWGVAPERITELDWWEETSVQGLRLVSTPARHFSGRGLADRNKTLWSSWALVGEHHRVWFSGDTGPAPFFDEIGERLGPFDATMIEVGAWNPLWAEIHLGPEAAVGVHRQVKGRVLIPVHWGTFNLALHAWDQPIVDLIDHAAAADVTLAAPIVGGTIDPDAAAVADFWLARHALARQ